MHTFGETGSGVPAFLAKLWRLVEDPETNHLIYWNKDGRSFIIQNQAQFARELLPLNYKHNNMASFIRQLNMYGFHKITSIDNGGLKFDRDEMEFSHPCFKRGHPYLLEHIKRKIATTKTTCDEKGLIKPEAVNKVLSEVKAMRGRQDSLDSRFSVMKQENEALWREIASLRQKHIKQQQIVNKLIQFLVTIVQPSRSNMSGVKRHFPLMINDAPQSSKLRKKSESDSGGSGIGGGRNGEGGGGGPVIHELTEELLDEVADSDADLLPNVVSPGSVKTMNSELIDDPNPDGSISNGDRRHSKSNPSSCGDGYDGGNDSGSENIVFHISEVPENVEMVDSGDGAGNSMEENVLNTPMVKIEMERQQNKQQLKKQKEKKQRRLFQTARISSGHQQKRNSAGSGGTPSFITTRRQYQQRQQQQQQTSTSNKSNAAADGTIPLKIKIEKDLDPLLFFNYSNDVATDNLVDSSLENQDAATTVDQQNQQQKIDGDNDKDMYGTGDFMTTNMPSDLFEDSSMIGDINSVSGSFNQNIDLKVGGGKSSNIGRDKNGNGLDVKGSGGIDEKSAVASCSSSSLMQKNQNQRRNSEKSMTLAKYNNSKYSDDEIMRLSTAEDFTSHLDNVQDDLENLRDILRGDGYSLDTNTVLGNNATQANRLILSSSLDGDILSKLFSDSDILTPFGLSISNENSQDVDRKGSELMTYQPYYADLSDILDINTDPISKSPGNYNNKHTKSPSPSSSVLNTPYRE